MTQAARGLSYLHECHLIHGDVKGANILVDVDGAIRICDFGLITLSETQIFASAGTSLNQKGTLRWMAPELFTPRGKRRKSSDVYAFGMTIVEVYTRRAPFSAEGLSDMQVMRAACDGQRPERPVAPNKEVTDRLWSLVCCCWDHAASARPSMSQVVDELDNQLQANDRNPQRGSTLNPTSADPSSTGSVASVDI